MTATAIWCDADPNTVPTWSFGTPWSRRVLNPTWSFGGTPWSRRVLNPTWSFGTPWSRRVLNRTRLWLLWSTLVRASETHVDILGRQTAECGIALIRWVLKLIPWRALTRSSACLKTSGGTNKFLWWMISSTSVCFENPFSWLGLVIVYVQRVLLHCRELES